MGVPQITRHRSGERRRREGENMRRAREKEADSGARAYTNSFVVGSLLLLFCLGLLYVMYYTRGHWIHHGCAGTLC
jgi:hypothetical protein